MTDVVVFGTGSFAELVHFYFSKDSGYRVVAFTVTRDYVKESTFDGLPVVAFEDLEQHYPPDRFAMFVAAGYGGMNEVRARFFDEAAAKGYELVTYVSSRCTHWGDAKIGRNCFIFEDNTIQPKVTIGDNVVLWSGNHVGHHAEIGDHTFVSSHVVISGHARVGRKCFVGVNSLIKDSVSVADSCFIGPGSLILKSTKEREVYLTERTKPHVLRSDQIGF
jgi:sugar O-acyltransferase (sialic acid O-acetyltransferase NeuD family)